jgi:hypothetical protein
MVFTPYIFPFIVPILAAIACQLSSLSHNRHNLNIFYCCSKLIHPVSANYETKNTNIFQLFYFQQTQSLLITLYLPIMNISGVQMKSWAGEALETVNCFVFLKCTLTVVIGVC